MKHKHCSATACIVVAQAPHSIACWSSAARVGYAATLQVHRAAPERHVPLDCLVQGCLCTDNQCGTHFNMCGCCAPTSIHAPAYTAIQTDVIITKILYTFVCLGVPAAAYGCLRTAVTACVLQVHSLPACPAHLLPLHPRWQGGLGLPH